MMFLIGTNKYGTYCVPKSTKKRISCRTILRGEVWEPETVAYVRNNVDGDIVHAGTYFGDMLPAFSQTAEMVWAFEPNQENFECATQTVLWNKLSNIHITKAGLSDHCSQAFFETQRDGELLGGAGHIVEQETNGTVIIQTTTIDSSVPADRKISIIHLDIEGYEVNALRGATKTLEQYSPTLILETKGKPTPAVAMFLSELQYFEVGGLDKCKHGQINTIFQRG